MANTIDPAERLVTAEHFLELGLDAFPDLHRDVVAMEERLPNAEGVGALTLSDLVERSRRLNPDRIIVGEVIGAEIVAMLDAMTQGNDGSLSTIHSRTSQLVFQRIATYALGSTRRLPVEAGRAADRRRAGLRRPHRQGTAARRPAPPLRRQRPGGRRVRRQPGAVQRGVRDRPTASSSPGPPPGCPPAARTCSPPPATTRPAAGSSPGGRHDRPRRARRWSRCWPAPGSVPGCSSRCSRGGPAPTPDLRRRGHRWVSRRLLAAAGTGLLVLVATRWVAAAVAAGVLVAAGPALLGGTKTAERRLDRLDALATWTESLRDLVATGVALPEALPASAAAAPPPLRGPLGALVDRLRTREPLPDALHALADDLDDPGADLVVAALLLNARVQGRQLRAVLTAIAALRAARAGPAPQDRGRPAVGPPRGADRRRGHRGHGGRVAGGEPDLRRAVPHPRRAGRARRRRRGVRRRVRLAAPPRRGPYPRPVPHRPHPPRSARR